jgi:hypothetical protein
MNMPFELGLTVMASYHNPQRHTWCVFEKNYRRPQKSLSDLAGTDVYSHDGRPKGVLRQVGNALVREPGPWTGPDHRRRGRCVCRSPEDGTRDPAGDGKCLLLRGKGVQEARLCRPELRDPAHRNSRPSGLIDADGAGLELNLLQNNPGRSF